MKHVLKRPSYLESDEGIAHVTLSDAKDLAGNEVVPVPTSGHQFTLDNTRQREESFSVPKDLINQVIMSQLL